MKDSLPRSNDIRRIYYKLQRKKNLIPEHATLTNQLNLEILQLKGLIEKESDEVKLDILKRNIRKQLDKKQQIEDEHFNKMRDDLQDYILRKPSKIRLKSWDQDGRKITTFNKRRSNLVLMDRYVSLLLSDSFRLRPLGRDQAVRTLINSLQITTGGGGKGGQSQAKARRTIIRIDIADFFENIRHDELIRRLSGHGGIPRFALRHIESILSAYRRVHEKSSGIPQGIPSSSALAEIYLEDLDRKMKQHPQVALYVRYVDDIVIICDRNPADKVHEAIKQALYGLGLELNSVKSEILSHPNDINTKMKYLGYEFSFGEFGSQLEQIDISENKHERYSKALDRLRDFGDSITCWAKPLKVNLYIGALEYLILPHETENDDESPRIVTGLAYNSRFVKKVGSGANLSKLVKAVHSELLQRRHKLALKPGLASPCSCCLKSIHRSDDLYRYSDNYFDVKEVMMTHANPHLDDLMREEIKEILWN